MHKVPRDPYVDPAPPPHPLLTASVIVAAIMQALLSWAASY